MRLTQRQLRSLVEQALTEAKVDPDDAAKQVQDAVKVLIKFGPMLASELSTAAQEARELGVVGDMADRLDDASFTLENVPVEFENMLDLVNTFKTLKKVVKQETKGKKVAPKAKAKAKAKEEPYRGGGSWHGGRMPGGRMKRDFSKESW